ncbi:MAG: tetratricopeptide repeat protein [Bryobacteraceae bacterium]
MSKSDEKAPLFIDESLLESLLGNRPETPAESPAPPPAPVTAVKVAPVPVEEPAPQIIKSEAAEASAPEYEHEPEAPVAAVPIQVVNPAAPEPAAAVCEAGCKDPEGTLRAFEALLAETPEDPRAMFGKAVMLQLLERDEEALDIYERLLAKSMESQALLANMISLSARRGEWEQAEVCAQRLLDLDPDSTQAIEALTSAALVRQDWQAASEYAAELTRKNPDSFEAWFNLGVARQHLKLLVEAIKAFEEAIRLRPDSVGAHTAMTLLYEAGKEPERAAAELSRVAELDPLAPAVLWRDAVAAEDRREIPRAEECFQKLLAAEAGESQAWLRYGCLRFNRADFKGARECFERALAADPDWVDAQLNYGLSCWKLGDSDAAISALGKVLAREPAAVDGLRALAAIHLERRDYREALELQSRLAKLGQPIWAFSYNLGLLHQHAGEIEAAAQCYQKALQDKPDFTDALVNLGQALKGLGREEEARFCLEEAAKAAGAR